VIAESKPLRFIHRLPRTLSAEVTIRDEPPVPGTVVKDFNISWTGRPKKKDFAEYRRWTLSIYQSLADRWERPIAYALGISPTRTELWECRPRTAPHLLRVLNSGI
jgi:hypothetical protein